MKGEVGSAAVAEKFRDTFISEESGALEVRSGSQVFAFQFDKGLLVGASDGVGPSGQTPTSEVINRAFACVAEDVGFRPTPASPGESQGDILRTVEAFLSGVRAM